MAHPPFRVVLPRSKVGVVVDDTKHMSNQFRFPFDIVVVVVFKRQRFNSHHAGCGDGDFFGLLKHTFGFVSVPLLSVDPAWSWIPTVDHHLHFVQFGKTGLRFCGFVVMTSFRRLNHGSCYGKKNPLPGQRQLSLWFESLFKWQS